MSEAVSVRSGGYYTRESNGTYMYYEPNKQYGLIKNEKEIREIEAMWSTKQWLIYYAISIICLIVFAVLLSFYVSNTVLVWVFGILTVISAALIVGPVFIGF